MTINSDNPIKPLQPWDNVSNTEPLSSKRFSITLSIGTWKQLLDILEEHNDTDLRYQEECSEIRETISLLVNQRVAQYETRK